MTSQCSSFDTVLESAQVSYVAPCYYTMPISRSIGRVLADASMFVTAAMSLAVFNLTKATKDGKVIEPRAEQTTGTIR